MKKIAFTLFLMAGTAFAQTPDTTDPDLRKPRTVAISAEIGMNSLASLAGVKATYFVTPQFALDAGYGLSSVGARPGVYARYLFSKTEMSSFAYGGVKFGSGTGGETVTVEDTEEKLEYELEVKPSAFVDFGFGFDYMAHNGFYFVTTFGWSQLMGGKNYEWVGNQPSDKFDGVMGFVLGSGPALSFSLGYAF